MNNALHLDNPPIIEAVVDINCDLPPSVNLEAIQENAKKQFADRYPKARRQILQQHEFRAEAEKPAEVSVRQQLGALQFWAEDEKQLVQIRPQGYSFNRLAPYGSLDEYLREIARTWAIFRELTQPVVIRQIELRYINRLLLPTKDGVVEFDDYFRISPHLPDEETMQFLGFINQHSAVDITTGNQVNITLALQPIEGDHLPVIFDIDTIDPRQRPSEHWSGIMEAILALRGLKNRVFERTLTEQCLNLYRQ